MNTFQAESKLAARKAAGSMTNADHVRGICLEADMEGHPAQWITEQVRERCDDMQNAKRELRNQLKLAEGNEDDAQASTLRVVLDLIG